MTEEIPDEPVRRVEVEHADGTTRVLEGDDAQRWAAWADSALSFATTHGIQAPDVDWREEDDG